MNNSYFTKRSFRVNQFVLYNICCYHPIRIKKWCTDFRIRQKRCQTRPSKECKSLIWIPIICKRPVPLDDHLQKAGPSGWSFARGRPIWMIICNRPVPPDDHLQEASPSAWSIVKGRSLQIIITTTTTTTKTKSCHNLKKNIMIQWRYW